MANHKAASHEQVAETTPTGGIAIPIPGVKGKTAVVGLGSVGGVGMLAYYAFQFIMSMHGEMVGKIAAVESHVLAVENKVVALDSKIESIASSRIEMKQDLRDIRNDLNQIARRGSNASSLLLPSERIDYTGRVGPDTSATPNY